MAAKERQPIGPPMTLANMYEQGVRHLIAIATTMLPLGLIDVSIA